MNRSTMMLTLSTALLVGVCHAARSVGPPTTRATTRRGDRVEAKAFDLRAVPPPTPALLYQLAFDPAERKPGSGAAAYLQAALLLTDAEQTLVDQAQDADSANDAATFNKAAQALFADARVVTILDLLDDAGRHETGGLDAVWQDVGIDALLPQLNPMRGLANLLRVRARQQTRAGDIAGAIDTARLTYQLARAVGDGGPLLCGMVGNGIAAIGDIELSTLMDLRNAPNLYWALATIPSPGRLVPAVDGSRAAVPDPRRASARDSAHLRRTAGRL